MSTEFLSDLMREVVTQLSRQLKDQESRDHAFLVTMQRHTIRALSRTVRLVARNCLMLQAVFRDRRRYDVRRHTIKHRGRIPPGSRYHAGIHVDKPGRLAAHHQSRGARLTYSSGSMSSSSVTSTDGGQNRIGDSMKGFLSAVFADIIGNIVTAALAYLGLAFLGIFPVYPELVLGIVFGLVASVVGISVGLIRYYYNKPRLATHLTWISFGAVTAGLFISNTLTGYPRNSGGAYLPCLFLVSSFLVDW